MEQRVRVASLEADAVKGENEAKASIADYEATLEERRADAQRRGEVALANAGRAVLLAERQQEQARLEKEQVVKQLIERQKVEIDAEAEAEKRRRIARGDADAILARYRAEAEGVQTVLEAKAKGYEELLRICGDQVQMAPTLLLVEKLPQIVAEQVKAIQNLKIDKVTVWDGGAAGGDGPGSTAAFLRSLIGSLPPLHDLARQAGVQLPGYLGAVEELKGKPPSP
jgi:flotillin